MRLQKGSGSVWRQSQEDPKRYKREDLVMYKSITGSTSTTGTTSFYMKNSINTITSKKSWWQNLLCMGG